MKTVRAQELVSSSSAILFDFNGTLSNDEHLLKESYSHALEALGLPLFGPSEYEQHIGLSDFDIAEKLLGRRPNGSISKAQFLRHVESYYVELAKKQKPIGESTLRWIRVLAENDKKLGIVTGTLRNMLVPILEHYEIRPYFQTIVTVEDVREGKPSAEGYLSAARMLETDPKSILVFEDSESGNAAALKAGMTCITVGQSLSPSSFTSLDNLAEKLLRIQ